MKPQRRTRRGPPRQGRPSGPRGGETSIPPIALTAQPTAPPELSRTVLTIAGVDPSGGAGIAADLNTIAAYRHHGALVVTSVTAQNTMGIQAIYDLPMEFIATQIESILSDMEVHAVKIGMLGTAQVVSLVAGLIQSLSLRNVVLDPVLRSTSGTALLEKAGVQALREKLIPRVDLVTPNMEEAGILSGLSVTDLPSMKQAARAIHLMGARQVVVTGGHLGQRAIDVLDDGAGSAVFDSTRITSNNTHGIGCTFSTAVACQLARGVPMAQAIDGAKRYVSRAVAHTSKIGKGAGPLNHLVTPF